ncbi:hypothetical protein N9C44_00165 [bacterium]|jgi:hypothetical protein|nr:hypothetical protein [bacterium]|tara:strand:+ start:836 stop:2134 length:1299 start_codon:yes stop_codon:yes gene_type:complete
MFIRDFNPQGQTKITKINKLLSEQFGMTIKTAFPKKAKIESIIEMADMAIVKLKDSSKQFQLQPEYAKYLGIKDIMSNMLSESMYAESPAFKELKGQIKTRIHELMDGGYTEDEAISRCANDCREMPHAYNDDALQPIIITAAKQYMQDSSCSNEALEELAVEGPQTDLNEKLLAELAKECGVELTDATSYDAIEEKLGMFAEVTGKSRDSVVGFLNGLEEDKLEAGIRYFGGQIAFENKGKDHDGDGDVDSDDYMAARDKAIKNAIKKQDAKESMFDDILNDMLAEEIEGTTIEEAEVVMAVRALADDIQDHVERLGRMVNEDIPAISDQMVHEFGAQRAADFKTQAETILQGALDSSKQAKDGVNQLVGGITGEDAGIMGDETGSIDDMPMGGDSPIDDMATMPEPEMDINEPAASGPESEPLGRAPVEG